MLVICHFKWNFFLAYCDKFIDLSPILDVLFFSSTFCSFPLLKIAKLQKHFLFWSLFYANKVEDEMCFIFGCWMRENFRLICFYIFSYKKDMRLYSSNCDTIWRITTNSFKIVIKFPCKMNHYRKFLEDL